MCAYFNTNLVAEKTLARKMGRERRANLAGLLEGGSHPGELLSRIPGAPFHGRDADGQPVTTRDPGRLKMSVNGMRVSIRYSRRETGKVEKGREQEKKKEITIHTDIFSGVRSLKHVRESYEAEFRKRDALLREVEQINASLALNGMGMAPVALDAIKARLEGIVAETSLDKAIVKNAGRLKMREVSQFLEAAKTDDMFDKQAAISAACAKLVAFRNRYGAWRDGEAAGIMGYNRLRECSLRAVRDGMLVHLLKKWADSIEKYSYASKGLWERDLEHSRRLEEIAEVVDAGHPGALARIFEITGSLKDRGIEARAKEELKEAYALLGNGEPGAASRIARACELLVWEKPWHVREELEKTGDKYLDALVGWIRVGTDLLMKENAWTKSAQVFRDAARKKVF